MVGHDIQAHERHSLDINVMAEEMKSNEHYDSENIAAKQVKFTKIQITLIWSFGFCQ